jgi:hypothetical protein
MSDRLRKVTRHRGQGLRQRRLTLTAGVHSRCSGSEAPRAAFVPA